MWQRPYLFHEQVFKGIVQSYLREDLKTKENKVLNEFKFNLTSLID